MNVLQKLVSDEIARRTAPLDEADQRLVDAKAQLQEAQANANRLHAEYDKLTAWLVANP
ncbi:hypothetical protein J7E70_07870 [Variovorax paradoxus]|nr:hypothetical protein [Variovorax paradoxus]MBT2300380.1 hypothetical protein [Variovorax paradoxus]